MESPRTFDITNNVSAENRGRKVEINTVFNLAVDRDISRSVEARGGNGVLEMVP